MVKVFKFFMGFLVQVGKIIFLLSGLFFLLYLAMKCFDSDLSLKKFFKDFISLRFNDEF